MLQTQTKVDYLLIVLGGCDPHPDEYIVAETREGEWVRQLGHEEPMYLEVLAQHGYFLSEIK